MLTAIVPDHVLKDDPEKTKERLLIYPKRPADLLYRNDRCHSSHEDRDNSLNIRHTTGCCGYSDGATDSTYAGLYHGYTYLYSIKMRSLLRNTTRNAHKRQISHLPSTTTWPTSPPAPLPPPPGTPLPPIPFPTTWTCCGASFWLWDASRSSFNSSSSPIASSGSFSSSGSLTRLSRGAIRRAKYGCSLTGGLDART